MSSLRPLATIALLAAVGVFLYMKINDSEPALSPEMADWATSELDIGSPAGFAAESAPQGSAVSGSAAPPFGSAALSPAPLATTKPGPAGDAAPAWSPGPLEVTPPAASADSSPVARSAEAPAMPAMPASPGGNATNEAPAFDVKTSPTAEAAAAAATAGAAAALVTTARDEGSAPTDPLAPPAELTTPTTRSMFADARIAFEGALDRGELATALRMLTDWYGDPSLTAAESKEVNDLLSQLAGSVIYEGPPAHRLLPAHIVQAGETLETVAGKYSVPPQLLAKINSISEAAALAPGQELKVVPGPFSARIDLSERKMTLMLGQHYAGQFALEIDPTASVEEGQWKVDQKLLTPAGGGGFYGAPVGPTEDRSLLLANLADPAGNAAVIRGPGDGDTVGAPPRGRVLHLKPGDVNDIYDILSVGSRVTIQR